MTSSHRTAQALAAAALLFALATASQFVRATYGGGDAAPPEVRADGKGPVRIVEGIPVVRLAGTHREIGRRHGELLKAQIHFLKQEYYDKFVVPLLRPDRLAAWADAVEEHVPEHYREELRGLAEGCGLDYRQVLEFNVSVDRFQAVFCSTVLAAGGETADGRVYFGRNLDFPGRDVLNRMNVVFVFAPEGETPVASVLWPGLIGVLSGMNAQGVAGATMMIHQGEEIRPGMPYPLLYREALARARTVGDVHDAIAAAKRTCPNNFMVVGPDGTAEVIEWDQARVARRKATRGGLCSTNHFRSDELRGTGWSIGVGRYESLERFLSEERGKIDLAAVQRALADVATPWFLNVQSMVFLPAERSLHLAVGGDLPVARHPFVLLDRETLFGAADER